MRILKLLLTGFCALVLLSLVAVPFLQIIMRDIIGGAIVGAEEFTRFLLIVLVFAAYPLVVAEHENIVMAEFHEFLPAGPRRAVEILITLGGAFGAGFIAWVVWGNIFKNLSNATPTLKIPFWIFLGFTFFGFATAAILHLINLRHPPREETRVF